MKHFDVEVSYQGGWVSLEHSDGFSIHAESLTPSPVTWRRTTASSPIMDGDVLIHATKGMGVLTLAIIVEGHDQGDVYEKVLLLEEILEQFSFRVRVTRDSLRETYVCQVPNDVSVDMSHIQTHNNRALVRTTIPHLPARSTERLDV